MTAAMTQMNVRINAEKKRRGDDFLASIGYTATEAVRKLYDLASGGAEKREVLRELLSATYEPSDKVKLADEGANLFENFFLSQGIALPSGEDGPTVDELWDEEYLERYAEGDE
jgi:hypothetical protein